MWQADTRRAPLCAALPLRPPRSPGPRVAATAPGPHTAGTGPRPPAPGAVARTMYAGTMRLPQGVCTDPV